jgi:hypothetical protein
MEKLLLHLPWGLSTCSTEKVLNKYRGFGVYSMNKTGGRRKVFITRANAGPFFGVKFLYDFWGLDVCRGIARNKICKDDFALVS